MRETYPPEGDQSLSAQPAETIAPGRSLSGIPEPPRKPKLDWVFALLGFAATGVLGVGITLGAAAVSSLPAADFAFSFISPVVGLLELAVFAGMMSAWIVGGGRGNNRLRSFGIGGLITYLVVMLGSLLVVGACFVSLGTGGGLFGN